MYVCICVYIYIYIYILIITIIMIQRKRRPPPRGNGGAAASGERRGAMLLPRTAQWQRTMRAMRFYGTHADDTTTCARRADTRPCEHHADCMTSTSVGVGCGASEGLLRIVRVRGVRLREGSAGDCCRIGGRNKATRSQQHKGQNNESLLDSHKTNAKTIP